MKALIFSLFFIGATLTTLAQSSTIRQIEYGWDTDNGTGQNTLVQVNQTSDNFNLNVATQGLTNGYHLLFLRGQDNVGRWSQTQTKLVYIQTGANPARIVRIEYAYSQGATLIGHYTYTLPSPATSVDLQLRGATLPLSDGQTYLLSIWATDEKGVRSQVYTKSFVRSAAMCETARIGNWSDIGMWICGHVPLATDDIFINPSHTATVVNGTFPAKNITFRGGKILFSQGGRLQLSGN
ncbi:hypothetical protein GCM10028807_16010 [Spirosoma daeguense]